MCSLKGRIAVVTGASRGAGRGIAYELGQAGATVYVTGRSMQESSTDDRPETIEQTAAGVTARGGIGIAVRCDHTDPDEITCLFQQIQDRHGRIDLLVNSVFGGSEASLPAGQGKRFWERPPEHWDAMMVAGPKAYLLTTRAAVPLLQQSPAALIVNLTSFSPDKAAGNLYYDLAMQSINRMTFVMGQELQTSRVASIALCPGFMRTERVVDAGFSNNATETTAYVGRAVVALAQDSDILQRTGQALFVADLARDYGFTDEDGTQPATFIT
ncbi:SDR family NAD(P)-dependent oxidoreductase [Exiguobacterium artemiae]|uniref:SDR family NAD(P)-dependent oxidoreductase n=1 Tax=Exiguobacterium artemiae TaxID=340145 RepID=UPI0029647221|nr:SDR family NAD(P)-dependent oxidoreductase [Exiguobacterium sibiricum]MDW2885278.1 SDR family NAD(P)-dependent oxidoreductase [Exiguobacterium sibiricum]